MISSSFGGASLIVASALTVWTLFLFCQSWLSKTNLHFKSYVFFFRASFVFIVLSFVLLVFSFINSDFSILSVYENSHTDKPFFYKISGTWGNHEGSMLLFILVISLYGFLFSLFSNHIELKLKSTTIFFQSVIQLIFLFFLIFTSNPFEKIIPVPNQGLGLNPILQDPLLAIHPPFLYLGYVGFSLVFSFLLAGLIVNQYDENWAVTAKRWIFLPWTFLTLGIGLGSFWAYYELGWGGYWFWDPVENASLMPWIAATALIHSILVMQQSKKLFNWTAILTILTFVLSLFGTFLVRSGILNSVHAFANDPRRGLFILLIISLITFVALIIYILKSSHHKNNDSSDFVIFSREFSILINNYLLIFALTVVIIGTTYPILLSVFTGDSVSVGPKYYNTILAPFIFIFLILMAMGPYLKWSKNSLSSVKYKLLSFLLVSIFLSGVASVILQKENTIFWLGLMCSFYLIVSLVYEPFYLQFKNLNYARLVSHAGFGVLMLSITLNYFFSKELSSKIALGQSVLLEDTKITFIESSSKKGKNFDELFGYYEIEKNNVKTVLKPSIRKYNQPQQFTSETSIQSRGLNDIYIAMDYSSDPSSGIGIRFYYNYCIRLIWLGFVLITVGGLLSFLQRRNENKN